MVGGFDVAHPHVMSDRSPSPLTSASHERQVIYHVPTSSRAFELLHHVSPLNVVCQLLWPSSRSRRHGDLGTMGGVGGSPISIAQDSFADSRIRISI